jgi:hypothetical protein
MAGPELPGALATFSTRDLPERDRLAAWRDFYAGGLLTLDWDPRPDLPFEATVAARKLADLTIYVTRFSPADVRLTRKHIRPEDRVTLFLPRQTYRLAQAGREIELRPGEAALLSNTEEAAVSSLGFGQHTGIVLSRMSLRMLAPGVDDMLARRVPRRTEELALLTRYLRHMANDVSLARPETQRVVATHLQDLVALMLGASREAAQIASGRGLAAARLAALKIGYPESSRRSGIIDTQASPTARDIATLRAPAVRRRGHKRDGIPAQQSPRASVSHAHDEPVQERKHHGDRLRIGLRRSFPLQSRVSAPLRRLAVGGAVERPARLPTTDVRERQRRCRP